MKGLELPINVLIIVAVALIVLLAVVAMYFSGFNPFTTTVGLEGVKNDACRRLVQEERCKEETQNIKIDNFDADKDGQMGSSEPFSGWLWVFSGNPTRDALCAKESMAVGDNLASLCACYFSIYSEGECKVMCGCPGIG